MRNDEGHATDCSRRDWREVTINRLVKLSLAIGAQSEGAVHSHVRRALEEDVSPEALEHAAILAIPTVGFPKAMAALSWIEDYTDES